MGTDTSHPFKLPIIDSKLVVEDFSAAAPVSAEDLDAAMEEGMMEIVPQLDESQVKTAE